MALYYCEILYYFYVLEDLSILLEQAHPCFDPVEISNPQILPEDLVPFYDEEDLLG